MTANRNLIESAYMQVNNVKRAELQEEKHQKIMAEALMDLWSYIPAFKGESQVLQAARRAMDSPESGEVSELAGHFKIVDTSLQSLTSWAVIFTMYNRMNNEESAKAEETDSDKLQTKNEGGTKGMKEFNKGNVEEEAAVDMEMGDNTPIENERTGAKHLEVLRKEEEAKKEAKKAAETFESKGVAPDSGKDTKAFTQASIDAYKKNQEARLAFTKNAVVQEFILNKPPLIEIAVKGAEAQGVVSDPESVYKNFALKTGMEPNGDGTYSFSKVKASSLDDAIAMEAALAQAKAYPEKKFQVYFSKSMPTLKGIKYAANAKQAGEIVKWEDVPNIIINQSVGGINTMDPSIQIKLQKATARNKTSIADKGKGTSDAKKNRATLSSIASTAISNRKDAFSKFGKYHKEIVKNSQEIKSGMRSTLSVQYIREGATDLNGKDKLATFRIPLKVEQYKLDILVKEYEKLGTMDSGVGKQIVATDFNDPKALAEAIKLQTELLATIAASDIAVGQGSIIETIRSAREDVKDEARNEQMNEMAAAGAGL